ncbi:M23 family metallopeptidase [Saccharothrix australiensis]|uniref:Peptidase M23-like protein n=1 Tax=Saccharothrix australiensis TaxID=2072 RepID=A0A495VX99_9PSEU|nr:M23 family metallopeptidase [Saccharothrix australiensis]RKT53377.1 peptidase M23-like protein [Saccharothrix australiensis]
MRRVLVTVLVTPLFGLVLTQGEASAAPNFQLPFPCNQVWEGQTRTNHSPANSVDFNRANDDGDPVVASAAGTVTRVANEGGTSYGRWVEIDHGGGWRTRYAHLSAQRVTVGQSVRLGQQIGNVGTTGGSTGPHLHYEQRLNGADRKVVFNGAGAYYWGTRSYTSRNSCSGVTGTVGTDSGSSVTVRSGPGTGYAAVGSVANGSSVTIRCQVKGQSVTGKYGTTALWDQIGSGYISDAYVYTGSDGQVAPAC